MINLYNKLNIWKESKLTPFCVQWTRSSWRPSRASPNWARR